MGAETTNPKLNVAIIGGGLGGIALSIGLLPYRDALNITIYEAAPKFAEIGAGIASGPNAVNALNLISPGILRGYRKCATFNETRDHDNAWLTFRYGKRMDLIHHVGEKGKSLGDVSEMLKREEIRKEKLARFLDEMAALILNGMAKFKKSLTPEEDNEGLKLTFEDGETVLADIVISCDGIKSVTRDFVMRNQSIEPVFSNTYAYRAMVPRDIAREAIGDALALNGQSYLGYGRYMISYPVEYGNLINLVALKTTKDVEWDEKNWLMPATREEMASDLEGYEEKLAELVSKYCTRDKWGLFHLPHSQKYFRGRICLMGDAAHASTPHLGAGSGMAFEDAYVLSRLFEGVKTKDDIQKALEAYGYGEETELVEFSEKAGELISFTHDDFGDDVKRIADEIDSLYEWVWTYDLEGSLVEAKQLSNLF
ncbi:hypothetical protein BTUL_0144g00230 [Botrytis tulipae]|uniref:FAD-binding domain-containing protein n=1 Tax=Botrytis tulipae TaxID=87230 RepID=A0A4Z1EFT7_9HELO|nr:hypothetical protein BTUL_0144g00230 [Botrytis tulipae]